MKKQTLTLIASVVMGAIFGLGAYYYKFKMNSNYEFLAQENASTFVRDYSPTIGSDDAKIYLVEFFDPACETCRQFFFPVKRILKDNPGKIKLVMRYAAFHRGAGDIIKVLEASRKQNKYWETLEIVYKYQPVWAVNHVANVELLWQYLPEAGVNVEQIKADMNSPEIEKIIAQDAADIKTLNVRKTPSFFVNGKPLEKFGYDNLLQLVKTEVELQYPN
jgi:protein-disulfide isomerase